MDLPELIGIDIVGTLLDQFADERFRNVGHHHRLLVVRAEVRNFLNRDQTHVVAKPRGDPAQMSTLRVQRLGELLEQVFKLCWRASHRR